MGEPDDFGGLLALSPFEKDRESGLGPFHDPTGHADRRLPRCPPDNATGAGKDREHLIPPSGGTSIRIVLSVTVYGVETLKNKGFSRV